MIGAMIGIELTFSWDEITWSRLPILEVFLNRVAKMEPAIPIDTFWEEMMFLREPEVGFVLDY